MHKPGTKKDRNLTLTEINGHAQKGTTAREQPENMVEQGAEENMSPKDQSSLKAIRGKPQMPKREYQATHPLTLHWGTTTHSLHRGITTRQLGPGRPATMQGRGENT